MKKSLILAAAAIAALSACSKEIEVAPINDSKAPVFTATIEDSATKTVLANGSTASKKKVEWLNTDKVYIVTADKDCNQGVVGTYNVTPGTPATTATLNPGTLKVNNSITTKITVAMYPASYSYIAALDAETIIAYGNQLIDAASMFNMPLTQQYNGADISQIAPMCAVNTDGSTQLEFKNIAALLAITVSGTDFTSVGSIKVSSNQIMNGLFLYYPNTGIFNSLPMPNMYTDANKVTTLNCQNEGVNAAIPAEGKTFYVSIPANTYEYLQIEVNGKKTGADVQATMKTKAASIEVVRNKIYSIAFADNQTPAAGSNLLAGEFSVSDTKKVKFTKGNLWCNTTTTPVTWAFETNQYDYPTAWSTSHVGHFYWTKTAAASYAETYNDGTNTASDLFWLDGRNAEHMLTVAGTENLYVLSKDEWYYLINSRASNLKYEDVEVAGKPHCLILAPDGYQGTLTYSYTAEAWVAAEADGLICLTTTGSRATSVIDCSGDEGNYLTSTVYSTKFYRVWIASNPSIECDYLRSVGSSIRLVKTVE